MQLCPSLQQILVLVPAVPRGCAPVGQIISVPVVYENTTYTIEINVYQ